MEHNSSRSRRSAQWFLALGFGVASALSVAPVQGQNTCGGTSYPFPYTDVSAVGAPFCPGIMEAYVTGVSKGTTPTTFSPNQTVTRVQMTTFLQRSLDQGLTRANRRAALNQFWVPQDANALQTIAIGGGGTLCAADGADIWAANGNDLVQVQANTGKVTGTWTGAAMGEGVLAAVGKVFVAGQVSPGNLYVADPTLAPGPVFVSVNSLGNRPYGIAFDGTNVWTANFGPPGSVSIISAQAPYSVLTKTTGFNSPVGILYDGAHIWVTDYGAGTLLKLDSGGTILQTVTVGSAPYFPVFDGTNIWVPNFNDSTVTVVQASTGNVVATIASDPTNLLDGPSGVAFDGERILVTNQINTTVTVFKAADLSFIANIGTTTTPLGACSDGINFWLPSSSNVLRF
jgi:hypothetical protein